MLKIYKKVPEQYLDEFRKKQTLFIKSRVHLLCVLTIALFFFATLAGIILDPEKFKIIEVFTGLALIAGGVVVLFLNHRVRTLFAAKINAYIFIAFLLSLLVRIGVDYAESVAISSALYVFTLFLVSMIIPWTPGEVIPLWVMHLAAFTVEFTYIRSMPGAAAEFFTWHRFIDGTIFMSMAFWLCIVVRKGETLRDIENFVLLKKVEEKNRQMRGELALATRVHKTIIPGSASMDKVDIAVSYLPAYYMGGDYVKYEFQGEDRLIFLMSDVTGHGVPAALLVNRLHAEFERLAKGGKQPGDLLEELNEFIEEDFAEVQMFLSAFCGLLDFRGMVLSYSNYGHPAQYLYRAKDSSIHGLCSQAGLLGLPLHDRNVYQCDVDVDKGDRLLLFTDGITETVNKEGEEYGGERVEEFLRKNHDIPVEEFNRALLKDLDTYKEGKFKDDICILDIDIKCHRHVFPLGGGMFKPHKKIIS
ncbi:MAG: PP2C family protein-serine/threonine phosphatase [Candidatus Omnitrophota bacterium]|nr:PP2C family protein-serine/threonine phosphatase [Candidatus Omnitrophota bacterium]